MVKANQCLENQEVSHANVMTNFLLIILFGLLIETRTYDVVNQRVTGFILIIIGVILWLLSLGLVPGLAR